MNRTTTATSGNTYTATCEMVQSVNPELLKAVQKVLRTAKRWQKGCCGTRRKFCEGFGCASIAELLEPLEKYRKAKLKLNPEGTTKR